MQVFDPPGAFVREVGLAGHAPGRARRGRGARRGRRRHAARGRRRQPHRRASTPAAALIARLGAHAAPASASSTSARAAATTRAPAAAWRVSGQYVYVADTGNDRIQRFTIDGGHGAVIVPPGTLDNPQGLAVRGTRLAVADDRHHRIVVFDTGGHELATVGAGPGTGPGPARQPLRRRLRRRRAASSWPTTSTTASCASAPRPSYPYKARWGSYGTASGAARLPARHRDGRARATSTWPNTGNDRVDVFDRSGALLRSFGTSGRAAGQFNQPARRRRRRRRLPRRGRRRQRPRAAPRPGRAIASVVGLARTRARRCCRGRRRRLRRRRQRLRARPARGRGSSSSAGRRACRCARSAPRAAAPGSCGRPRRWRSTPPGRSASRTRGNDRIARFTTGGAYLGAITDVPARRAASRPPPDGRRIYVADDAQPHHPSDRRTATRLDALRRHGHASSASSTRPAQLALDGAGNLWVADRGNNRVQQFGPDGAAPAGVRRARDRRRAVRPPDRHRAWTAAAC